MLLAYDDYGPGPVVVLLHGFPLHRKMWAAQESSVGSIYRVIAPDLRGLGESAAPEGVYTIDAMADDVIDLLDALSLFNPVVLGGLSMGGYVALSLIARHPDRFRALMLFDTRATADTPTAARGREDLARRVEETHSAEPVTAAMLPRLLSDTTRAKRPELVPEVAALMRDHPHRALTGALRGMAIRPDRTANLAQIRVPTLVMVGEEDAITPPDEARALAEQIPNARLVVVPDAGHLAPLENPGFANREILAFLASLT